MKLDLVAYLTPMPWTSKMNYCLQVKKYSKLHIIQK